MKTTIFYFVLLWAFSASYRMNNKLMIGLSDPESSESVVDWLPEEEHFSQKLDHFNPIDRTTWLQRYWVNPAFYEKGKPGFLMINGEAGASAKWSVIGQWIEYAKTYNASCFLLEHRFYGNSKPTADVSTKNLKYLSSEQALADIAYFIAEMKKKYETGQWIVFGGSYAGSLAAWARVKYPHLIAGAVSSSGPLLAKIDFNEYFQVVNDSLSSYSPKCVESIKEAQVQLDNIMKTEGGKSLLTKEFQLCNSLKTTANLTDVQSLFENLAGNFADVVQYNRDNRESVTKNVTIPVVCDVMNGVGVTDESSVPAWRRYAAVNKLMLQVTNQTCLSYSYEDYINNLRKTDWDSASEYGRQWMYQTCTEFGFYQTSSKSADLFGSHFPIAFFTEQCRDIFGPNFDEDLLVIAVNRTNVLYGERKINVNHVAFVHGNIDPWHVLGVTDDLSRIYSAFLIPDTAHCADMYPPCANDSLTLQNVRVRVTELIGQWLSNQEPLTYLWFVHDESFSRSTMFAGFYVMTFIFFFVGLLAFKTLFPSKIYWANERYIHFRSGQSYMNSRTLSSTP